MQDYKMPIREQNSNKGTFGKVLNICGSENYVGAAYLSTISSLKVGAGYSALASTRDVIRSVSAILPEAVYINQRDCLKKLNNYNVILIGCGLGLKSSSEAILRQLLKRFPKETTLVMDADALNILSKRQYKLPVGTVITPHPLEASRLLGCSLEEVLQDIESSAKKLSEKYNCITVLKTHRTIICNTDLTTHRNENGNSALAKAGSGDVLAGIIAGLIAQGMECYEAAKLGVYLHSRTGEIASRDLTEYSVLASDLPQYLHKAINELL
ncbi:MAG: NAD(P)H-hydrate dehydratase [Cyanobacteria bacterium SIG31]|nr:NAD(P)H-hydrate dehydratase [Cyanobacteria bacterium SIG31]